jgi:ABC-type bacteriocin/lantibiotic exporter with double-glycine peptidase domain
LKECEKKEDKDEMILNNINIEIKEGEMIGIIGEVGSGKSSVLKSMA